MSTLVEKQQLKRHEQDRDRAKGAKAEGWRRRGPLLPALIFTIIVTQLPFLFTLWYSLQNWNLLRPDGDAFVGLSNYFTVMTDSLWWTDVFNTVVIMVLTVAVELVIGFAFAMVMHRVIFGRKVVRTSILIPYGIITVVSAFAWKYAFALDSGFINNWFGLGDFAWFGERWSSIAVICLSEIWKTTPFISLLLLAGLAQVPSEYTEAARVDGASWWQRMSRVILPNMKAAIMVAVVFRALDAFRIFDNIFIMTGGANDTSSLSMLIYRQTIDRTEIGLGSALSVILFLCVLVIAAVFVKAFKVDLAEGRG